MKILIDNREKKALFFNHKSITSVENTTLSVGDYGALFQDNFSPRIFFERKSIQDLYGTFSQGYLRFKKEIERAKEQNVQLIIIVEGSISRILQGTVYSKRTPQSVLYQIFTLRVRYNIETVFCKDAVEMAEYISQFFIAHYKEYEEKLIKERL